MIRYEKSGKTMDKKGWCGDDFSDVAVPEKLYNFFWPKGDSICLNEGPCSFQRGDNNEIGKIYKAVLGDGNSVLQIRIIQLS